VPRTIKNAPLHGAKQYNILEEKYQRKDSPNLLVITLMKTATANEVGGGQHEKNDMGYQPVNDCNLDAGGLCRGAGC
jgi:hypothetical protein